MLTRRTFLASSLALASAACAKRDSCKQSDTTGRKRVRLTHPISSVPKTRGVFEKRLAEQGLDVEWIGPFPNHAPTLQAVATDSADFSFGGSSTPAAQAILSGSKLSIVAWSRAAPRNTSIIVLPSSKIRSVQDLVGKTVAVNKAGVGEFLLVAALEKYGVPRDKVNVSYLNPPDAAPAFASDKVDAWSIWTGPLELAEHQYGAQRIFEDGKELDMQIDFGSYLVRDEYGRREPDTIRKVVAAYQAEAEWVNEHFAEGQLIAYQAAKYPQPVIDRIVASGVRTHWQLMNEDGIWQLQRGADWLTAHRVLSDKIDIAQHVVRL
jgi:sulfonate transport system substrate-binding protein